MAVDGGIEDGEISGCADVLPVLDEIRADLIQCLEAERDELVPRHLPGGDVLHLLDEAFRGEAIVVRAERVEDIPPAHALEPRDEVLLRVREGVPDVHAAGDRWRRGVDGVDLSLGMLVEPVDVLLLPKLPDAGLCLPRIIPL